MILQQYFGINKEAYKDLHGFFIISLFDFVMIYKEVTKFQNFINTIVHR